MDKHTTSISSDRFRPLEVEWVDDNDRPGMGRYKVLPNGASKRMPGTHISLVHPGHTGRTRIIDLSPQTALNLLAWLERDRETLQQAAVEWEEANRD